MHPIQTRPTEPTPLLLEPQHHQWVTHPLAKCVRQSLDSLTIILLAHVHDDPSTDINLPLRTLVLQLLQDLLLGAGASRCVLFAPNEVSVQLRLCDEEVELSLLSLCLQVHSTKAR